MAAVPVHFRWCGSGLSSVLIRSLEGTGRSRCLARQHAPVRSPLGGVLFFSSQVQRGQQRDLYAVLGVSPKSTQEQIKTGFYTLSKTHHPDRNQGSEESHDRFSEITAAYEVLSSYELRRKYDKGILYSYPNPARQPSQPPPSGHAHSNAQGQKGKFDFDEFYRAHYGTVRRRQKMERERREEAARSAPQVLTENQQAGLRLGVIGLVLAAGWLGHRLAV